MDKHYCRKCGFECSLEEARQHFYKHKSAKTRYQAWCKKCLNAYVNEWRREKRAMGSAYKTRDQRIAERRGRA